MNPLKHLNSRVCLLLGLVSLAVGSARAQIVYVASSLTLGQGQSAYIDFNQDGINDLLLSVDGALSVSFNGGVTGAADNATHAQIINFVYTGTAYNPAVKYDAGVSISGSPIKANNGIFRQLVSSTEYGQFADTTGYAAAVIQTGTYSSGAGFTLENTYYGWLNLGVDTSSSSSTLRVYGWAFESSSGTAILTGAGATAVPEPSTYAAIFGVLVLGFAGWRKYRQSGA